MIYVHLQYSPEPPQLELLQELLDSRIQLTHGEQIPDDCHIIVSGRPKQEFLEKYPNVHTLLIPFAGLPISTGELMQQYPHIAIHNLHHNAASTAEMAFALMIAASKSLLACDKVFRNHDWSPRYNPNHSLLLQETSCLILGYGAIGKRLATMCQAFGMTTIATRRTIVSVEQHQGTTVYPPEFLPEILPQANFLAISLPHTPQTKHLITDKELKLLPPNAVLVNVGRADIVHEQSLYDALEKKHLFAAGLDVWYNYPTDEVTKHNTPPANYPFHELDNVIMSPHRAGSTTNNETLRMQHLAQSLNMAAQGRTIPNQVNLEHGY